MNQVLLIFPEVPRKFESDQWIYPNLALLQLGTVIENANYNPKILNIPQAKVLNIDHTKFLNSLSGISVACISAYSFQLKIVKKLIKSFKEKEIKVILGGALASTSPEEALLYCGADYAVAGEGEYTLPKLLDFITKGRNNLDDIENVWYPENGRIKDTFRTYIKNLDEIPIINFKLQNFEKLYSKIFEKMGFAFFPLESSRGCYANCSFCSSKQIMGNWRKKSAKRLIDEIQTFEKAYPKLYKHQNFGIIYIDNTATADPQRIFEFTRLKQEADLKIPWACMSRINEFSERRQDLITEMTKSGHRMIFFGIESGYDEGLKKINKKITVDQINEVVKYWVDYSESIIDLSFIVSFPWETKEDIEQTLNFAKDLKEMAPTRIKISISYFNLFKRTQLYEELKKQYKTEIYLDKLNSFELLNRHWSKTPKRWVFRRIQEFDQFNKQFELILKEDESIQF